MENPAEEVQVGLPNGLLGEEIVRHEGNSALEIVGDGLGGVGNDVGKVLDRDRDGGMPSRQFDGQRARGSADVDHGLHLDPVEVVEEV